MERRLRRTDVTSYPEGSIQQDIDEDINIAPEVVEPEEILFPSLKVTPLVINRESRGIPDRWGWIMVIIGAVLGLISGFLVGDLSPVRYQIHSPYSARVFFPIWGPFIGAIVGFCLFPPYTHMKRPLPLFSVFLFIPVILYLLAMCGVLVAITNVLAGIGKILLYIIGIGIAILIIIGFFSG